MASVVDPRSERLRQKEKANGHNNRAEFTLGRPCLLYGECLLLSRTERFDIQSFRNDILHRVVATVALTRRVRPQRQTSQFIQTQSNSESAFFEVTTRDGPSRQHNTSVVEGFSDSSSRLKKTWLNFIVGRIKCCCYVRFPRYDVN